MKFPNAVFIVTEEYSCPLYNVGEEFTMQDSALTVECEKQVCLILMHELLRVLADANPQAQKAKFECGGCSGLIRFERKKEKGSCSALQMNLLKAAEQRANQHRTSEVFSILRAMDLFEPLNDVDLQTLALMMKLKHHPPDKIIIEEGERGRNCYVVLSGQVTVARKDSEAIAELGPGGVFGEMSLLSGELTYPSVYSRTAVQLAALNSRDFKLVLSRYPILQIFFYRLFIRRCGTGSIQVRTISSSMSGELADIGSVELFQAINVGGKTGKADLILPDCTACVIFNEGEIIHASFGALQGRDALFALLAQQKGRFIYTEGLAEEEKNMPILGGFMCLLLEGLQHLDESIAEAEPDGHSL